MFCLSLIEHDLRLPPHLLGLPLHKAIRGEIERLFLDKVISNLGLCVSVYDIRSIEGGFILPGDGASTYKVVFRLVMFRPFIGEVLIGKTETSDESGLKISLGFFNDIHIPAHLLQQPNKRGEDGIWLWQYTDESLSLDLDEEIRFRVNDVRYPPIPVRQEENAKPFAPMEIIGDIRGDGLGLLSWWED
uniref:DNA-directed RNA polymerase subunit n=1 Tax=Anthurium amnicola TaxID=1678845 RepID=A0A1D1Z3B8_9ARAE